ncbi:MULTISPECIES: B12-binding domain-containing radical SAM protein [Paenibacillus]|uniref:B12-binding domain-containing radical SAM protein n=1 Tax=Paenibacillus alvei TaxID=44250 RepID=A0ABT4E8G9_PAEAL|nr:MULTISPECIES: radical SAM protein [Paenibacillus]EPY13125.1 radical SAM protein [Paenibacillus alvei A6-6i-x]MCY9529915.1 B12-binding domain-containing radical SAM protein [Paenibacillus alvei]
MISDRDILLIFPPLTEARFFPYLSLPMLTSYLRKNGVSVVQEDLNIKLSQKLASYKSILEYRDIIISKVGDKSRIAIEIRRHMCDFMLSNYEAIYGYIFEKNEDKRSKHLKGYELDFVRKIIEMILEGSLLKKEFCSFDDIDNEVIKFNAFMINDISGREFLSDIKEIIKNGNYQIVGISVAFYSQVFPSLIAAKIIKSICPTVKIIFGGPQITLFHEKMINLKCIKKYIDYLGIGDGEETLLMLHKYLNGEEVYSNIPNIIDTSISKVKQKLHVSNLHINEKPILDFDGLPIRNYMSHGMQLGVISCAGCSWGRCTFCSYGNRSRSTRNYQQKRIGQIADEFEFLIGRYGIKRINFVDENTNIKLIMKAMKRLKERGYKAEFSIRCRLEDTFLDKELCFELKDLGCTQLSVGYETFSQRVLDIIDKGVTSANFQQIVDNIYDAELELRLNIIGGLPTETEEEAKESLHFLKKNENKLGIDVIQMLVAEPRSFLTEREETASVGLEIKKNSNILIGNKVINYGMGRMGYEIEYKEGANYEERKKWMMQILHQVKPALNTEIQKKNETTDSTGKYNTRLLPWVKCISVIEEEREITYIVNLLFEKIYLFPETLLLNNDNIEPKSSDNEEDAYQLLQQFIEIGLAEC